MPRSRIGIPHKATPTVEGMTLRTRVHFRGINTKARMATKIATRSREVTSIRTAGLNSLNFYTSCAHSLMLEISASGTT